MALVEKNQRLPKKGTDDGIAIINKDIMHLMLLAISWSVPFLRVVCCSGFSMPKDHVTCRTLKA